MDCMREWSDRMDDVKIQKILGYGEMITRLPPEEKPMRVTLLALQLVDDHLARSIEEGYVILMEAYAHAENMRLMEWYEQMLNDVCKAPSVVKSIQVNHDA